MASPNINVLELLAIEKALIKWHQEVMSSSVLIRSDNTTAVSTTWMVMDQKQ